MFDRFTSTCVRAIETAEDEVRTHGHDHVGSAHLLLGIVSEDRVLGTQVFGNTAVARDVILRRLHPDDCARVDPNTRRLPYSRQAKRSLEMALSVAGGRYVTTDHLLEAVRRVDTAYFDSVLAEIAHRRTRESRSDSKLKAREKTRTATRAAARTRRPADRAISQSARRSRTYSPYARSSMTNEQPAPRVIAALAFLFLGTCATGLSALIDIRAFTALATPVLYAWCGLSAICTLLLLTIRALQRWHIYPPRYVWWVLALGIAGGLFTLPTAWQVLTKHEQHSVASAIDSAVDWRGKTIENESLAHSNLRRAQLQDVVFRHVDLSGADLAEADLRGARFVGVDLSGANLCGADIRSANLAGAEYLEDVASWDYTYYNGQTKLPSNFSLALGPGPIPDTHRGLLYMCTPNETHRIPAS